MNYYHGSNKPLQEGTVLKGRLRHPEHRRETFARLERMVERRRPKKNVSRRRAVFMVSAPSTVEAAAGDEMQYVYRVDPTGSVSRHNFGWLEEILWDWTRKRPRMTAEQTASNIDAYWAGKPYRGAVPSFWEYLAPSATVVSVSRKYSPGLRVLAPRRKTPRPRRRKRFGLRQLDRVLDAGEP